MNEALSPANEPFRFASKATTLERLGISYEQHVMSAHRAPDRVAEFARGAADAGIEVLTAGAGGAAALPGVTLAAFHARFGT